MPSKINGLFPRKLRQKGIYIPRGAARKSRLLQAFGRCQGKKTEEGLLCLPPGNAGSQGAVPARTPHLSLGELGRAAGGLQAVLAYSLAPVFLDFMGFLASALKCCPSI